MLRTWQLRMMKKLINPEDDATVDLWDIDIRPAVEECFHNLAGADKTIDVVEFEAYLNRDWKKAKARMRREKYGDEPSADEPGGSTGLRKLNRKATSAALLAPRAAPAVARPASAERKNASGSIKARLPEFRRAPAAPAQTRQPPRHKGMPPADDRSAGWELREYLATLCAPANAPRPLVLLRSASGPHVGALMAGARHARRQVCHRGGAATAT
jgi:hypothetical protein